MEGIVEQAKHAEQEAASFSDKQLADKLTEPLIDRPLAYYYVRLAYAREAAERLREYADERALTEQAYLDSLVG